MHVLVVAPEFPANQRQFVRALKEAGAAVTGIGEVPADSLPGELKGWLDGWERVRSVVDEGELFRAVRAVQQRGWVDRLEATVEAHILTTAKVREACSIPGLTYEAAVLCRDKTVMKEFLRKKGIPCAQSAAVDRVEDALQFAHSVGYPVIVKPLAGAGASGTYRCDDDDSLESALAESSVPGNSVAIEEFIEGHEGFYDTLTVRGQVGHEFISHYYPGVLHAMRTRWISPQILTTNRVDVPAYNELKVLGRKVIEALSLGTTATHMEWFYGPKGLKFSEIGARPPGVLTWDLYNAANDFDLYREWAFAIVHGRIDRRPSRRYSSGLIAIRPDRDGRVSHVENVDWLEQKYGSYLIDAHIQARGTPTGPVEAGFMANTWIRVKHPDYDTLRSILDDIARNVRVRAM
jgi:hypothetical protein